MGGGCLLWGNGVSRVMRLLRRSQYKVKFPGREACACGPVPHSRPLHLPRSTYALNVCPAGEKPPLVTHMQSEIRSALNATV